MFARLVQQAVGWLSPGCTKPCLRLVVVVVVVVVFTLGGLWRTTSRRVFPMRADPQVPQTTLLCGERRVGGATSLRDVAINKRRRCVLGFINSACHDLD